MKESNWEECYVPKVGEYLGIKLKVTDRDKAKSIIKLLGENLLENNEWNGFSIESIDYCLNKQDIKELQELQVEINTRLNRMISEKYTEDKRLGTRDVFRNLE